MNRNVVFYLYWRKESSRSIPLLLMIICFVCCQIKVLPLRVICVNFVWFFSNLSWSLNFVMIVSTKLMSSNSDLHEEWYILVLTKTCHCSQMNYLDQVQKTDRNQWFMSYGSFRTFGNWNTKISEYFNNKKYFYGFEKKDLLFFFTLA